VAGLRGYDDQAEMNEALIEDWNSKVTNSDIVYIIGDLFCYAKKEVMYDIPRRLNGCLHLFKGNHDHRRDTKIYDERIHIRVADVVNMPDGQRVWMSHCAHRVWPGMDRGNWHFYGHSHGSLPEWGWSLSTDVGIDNNPEGSIYEYEDLRLKMAKRIELAESKPSGDLLSMAERMEKGLANEPADIELIRRVAAALGSDHHSERRA